MLRLEERCNKKGPVRSLVFSAHGCVLPGDYIALPMRGRTTRMIFVIGADNMAVRKPRQVATIL
jgi:hypothetical protein